MIVTEKNYAGCPVGAKAAALFKMRENGFNVPPLFCVVGEDAEDGENFGDIAAELFGGGAVSVRSSASAEDGRAASFAGQFSTELNVAADGTAAAVRRVRTLPEGAGFAEYCKINGIAPETVSVCAIVQKMVDAEVSGVVFTANPQGLLNEAVVVVGAGTGDNVVGDRVSVTTYYFNNSDGLYYSERRGGSPTITEKTLKELLARAAEIKELFGGESEYDVEFAIKDGEIFILQARPITALPQTELPIILDNSNIVESYPGITLPLTQSFIRTAYYRVFRAVLLRLTREPETVARADDILRNMVDAANGRIYYRISNWYDIILFLPFSKRIIPVWQEMLGVKNKSVTSRLSGKIGFMTRLKVTLSFVRLILSCPKLMNRLEGEFGEMIGFFGSLDLGRAGGAEILEHYAALLDRVTEKWDITLVNDMYSFIFTGLLKARLRAKGAPDAAAEANRLISGINGIESMKPAAELAAIAELAAQSGELGALKLLRTPKQCAEFMAKKSPVAERMARYIGLYGDRNAEELKLESPTFRTNPELLAQRIAQYAESGAGAGLSAGGVDDAGGAGERAKPPRGLAGFFAKKAALGIKNRESSRLNRSRLYGMMRAMMLRVGDELSREGRLESPRDVFFLEYGEVERAVRSGEDMRELVRERRVTYERFKALPAYSRLVFAERVFDKAAENVGGMESALGAGELSGVPCSGGTARGEALVVEDPAACPDTTGKIIVAKMTDPGWVFLLVGAAGIVTEKGSLLSHTAIISRELGKPAVVGVEGAARLLKSGDILEVDGDKGKVRILKQWTVHS